MGMACGTRGECKEDFVWKDRRKDAARWENNIKIGLRQIGCGGMERIYLAQAWWFLKKDSDISSHLVNKFFFPRLLQQLNNSVDLFGS
jgi:hypothetical protein